MSQKLENLLNLALDADQGERERSEELDVGYDKEENVITIYEVPYEGYIEDIDVSSDDGGHHQYMEQRYINAIYWLAKK